MHSKERKDEGEMSRKSISGSWYSLGTEEPDVKHKLGSHFFFFCLRRGNYLSRSNEGDKVEAESREEPPVLSPHLLRKEG